MFPIQQYFTNYRKPVPRVFTWTFRNSVKINSVHQAERPRELAANSSPDTMTSLEAAVTTTNGVTNGSLHDAPVEPTISFDPEIFRSYLLALLPPLIGASPPELEYLFDDEFEDRIHKFAGEGGGTVYVVKKREDAEGEYEALTQYSLGAHSHQTMLPPPFRITSLHTSRTTRLIPQRLPSSNAGRYWTQPLLLPHSYIS